MGVFNLAVDSRPVDDDVDGPAHKLYSGGSSNWE